MMPVQSLSTSLVPHQQSGPYRHLSMGQGAYSRLPIVEPSVDYLISQIELERSLVLSHMVILFDLPPSPTTESQAHSI